MICTYYHVNQLQIHDIFLKCPVNLILKVFLFMLSKANFKTDLAPLFTDESVVKQTIPTVAWYDIIKDIPEWENPMAYQTLWVKKDRFDKKCIAKNSFTNWRKIACQFPEPFNNSIWILVLLDFLEKRKSYHILWVTEMMKNCCKYVILLQNKEKLLANFPTL